MVIILEFNKGNFFSLNESLAKIAQKQKIKINWKNNFNVEPIENIKERFQEYIKSYSYLKKYNIKTKIDKSIFEILAKVQQENHKDKTEKNKRFLLRILGILTNNSFIGPEYFHLDLFNPCNLDCNYCWFYSKYLKNPPLEEFKSSKIELRDFKNIVEDLAFLRTDTILFTGAGEPLLHPDIKEMISYVKSRNIGLQIFTNGTMLNEDIVKTIIETKTDELFISVSASNPETYMRVHPKQKKEIFFKVDKNIKKLLLLKKEIKQDLPNIILLFVLCKDNYKDMMEMAEWSFKIGATSIRYQLAHNDDAKNIELNKQQRDFVRNEYEKVEKKIRDKIHLNPNLSFQLENTRLSNEWYHKHFEKKGCFVGWFFSRLWADKKISFCCIKKEVEHLKHRNSFKAVWDSEKYREYRKAAKSFGKENIQLKKNYCLIDKDCSHCGNYELNEKAYNYLDKSGFLKYL